MYGQSDPRRWNDCRLLGAACSRSAPGAGRARAVSRTDLERLTDHGPCSGRLLGQLSIGIEDHCDRFLQIRARFVERGALRVGAGQLLNETDVPLGHLAEHGRELKVHTTMIRLVADEARRRFARHSISFARDRDGVVSNVRCLAGFSFALFLPFADIQTRIGAANRGKARQEAAKRSFSFW